MKICKVSGMRKLFVSPQTVCYSAVICSIWYLAASPRFAALTWVKERRSVRFCSTTWNMRGNHRLVNCPTGTRAPKLAARNSIKCTLAARAGICTKPQTPLKRDFTRRRTVRGSPVVTGWLKASRDFFPVGFFGLFQKKVKGRRKANSFKETCVE